MTFAETILPEFEHEMSNTRRVLERVPEDKLDWRPHPKSHTIGWNANHLADLPGWGAVALLQSSFDFAPVGGARYQTPEWKTRRELLESFDKNVGIARKAISEVKAEDVGKIWSLLQGGNVIFTQPRGAVFRSMVLNHIIHHRAILCVYLRLNDVPVPGMYGPSGDE